MPVVFLITIAAVLVGIFFAATGRGGEMAYEHADHAPLDLGPVTAADVALLRPPTAMWGYNMQVTDEALDLIARAMRERDVTIAYLQEQLATAARNGSYAEPGGAQARLADESPLAPDIPFLPGAGETSQVTDAPEPIEPPVAAEAAEYPEPPVSPQFPEAPASPETADIAEAPLVPRIADTPDAPKPLQTPLILKASPTKASPAPDPHEATQPSEILRDPEDDKATQPSETLAPHEPQGPQGPQGVFNTHDWWAEQEKAAREEAARRAAADPSGAAEDDSVAAAEEQGW